jgi:ABC-2 type transport system ATP-binding protein
VILTTHDLNDIEELCERVMIIDSGKIVYDGRLQALKERLGRTRRVAFEFSEPVSVGRLQRVLEGRGQDMGRGDIRIRQVSLYRLECSFDRTEVSASRLIERVMDQLTVRDLVLEEPAIEDVVQRIYEDKDSLSDVVG